MATLILAAEQGISIDRVMYVEVKFNDEISGEHPIMAEWIPTAEKRLKELFGVTVDHAYSGVGFEAQFWTRHKRGALHDMNYGFPHLLSPWCNSCLKIKAINKYFREVVGDGCHTQFVGIAADEHNRWERMEAKQTAKKKYRSLLVEQGLTENDAMGICKKYDLLSPLYSHEDTYRGGVGSVPSNVWQTCGAFGRTTQTFITAWSQWNRIATILSSHAEERLQGMPKGLRAGISRSAGKRRRNSSN